MYKRQAFELLTDREEFDAVIASDPEAPACLAAAASYRGQTSLPEVYAVTGKELRPFSGAIPYELNYRLCGRRIGKYIGGLEPGTAAESLLRLENDGFHHCPVKAKCRRCTEEKAGAKEVLFHCGVLL